jgi:predicted ATPase/DNA-binding SARP family transcriptional activator/tetratricopeptide (TPR) repeat protein
MLEIRTLGGLSLKRNGQVLRSLGSHKAEAILVYIGLKGGLCNRNVLATLFWPECAESQAMTSLRVALSIMRHELGDYLDVYRDMVGIKPSAQVSIDIADLEAKLANHELEEALEIYQGDFMQGFHLRDCLEFEDWRRLEQERVYKLITGALHSSISAAIFEEDYPIGLNLVDRLLEIDPLDEQAHRNCMLLLALDGQHGRAIEQYKKCQSILQAELGIVPAQETQSLYTQILKGEKLESMHPMVSLSNLPIPQTSFFGREHEISQIASLLSDSDCRLLTLLGPGGIGKTRLALRAVVRCFHNFQDGSYFVPLEGVVSSDYLVHAIADAIQFKIDDFETQFGAKRQLLAYLRIRSILLVMDGFENWITSGGMLSEILGYAPRIKILVTSRQKLGLQGEWIFPVTGLPLPQASGDGLPGSSPALELFAGRARQAHIEFKLSNTDQEYVTQICQLVEGMPLGIELAASWTQVLSLNEIAQEIQNNLDFLSSSLRDRQEKHHSIRATFDGSWQLLNQVQRNVFCKLAIFQGGFDREAALGVAGADISQVSSLLDRSMLGRDHTGRFHMHSLLRQYGIDKLKASLSAWDDICDQHCYYYTQFLLQREEYLLGHQMYIAWNEVRREMDNMRMAVDRAVVHGEGERARKILAGLLAFYAVQGWHEGKDTFNSIAQSRMDVIQIKNRGDWKDDPVYLCARAHQAFFLCNLGQIEESEALSKECLEPLSSLGLYGELSECIHNLGVNASFRGEYQIAIERLEQAIQLGKKSQNSMWPSYLLWLGHACFLLGEYERGLESLQKCYEIFDRQGNYWGMAFAASKMGLAADGLGDFSRAKKYHRQALDIFEKTDNQTGKGYALSRMSESAYFLEEYQQAVQLAEEAYQIFRSLGHLWGICTTLCRLGFGYIGLGEEIRAENCFREALEQSRKYQTAPLSLYALAGMAAAMLHLKGREKVAVDLFRYIRDHPQTPALSVQQTARWFPHQDQKSLENGLPFGLRIAEPARLETIIDRVLRM